MSNRLRVFDCAVLVSGLILALIAYANFNVFAGSSSNGLLVAPVTDRSILLFRSSRDLNSYFTFSYSFTCDGFKFSSVDGATLFIIPNYTYNNVHLSEIGFAVKNGNMTINKIESNLMEFTVSGVKGNPVNLYIYAPTYGMPVKVVIAGANIPSPVQDKNAFDSWTTNCWMYNPNNKIIYVKAIPQSTITVLIDWRQPSYIPPPEEKPPTPPTPTIPTNIIEQITKTITQTLNQIYQLIMANKLIIAIAILIIAYILLIIFVQKIFASFI